MRGKVATRTAAQRHRAHSVRHLPDSDDVIFWIGLVLAWPAMWWVFTRPEGTMHYWAFLTSAPFFLGGIYIFRRARRRVMNADRRSAKLISVTRTLVGTGQFMARWFDSVVEVTMADGSLKRMPLRSSYKPREPLEVAIVPKGLVLVRKLEQADKAVPLWFLSGIFVAFGVFWVVLV